MHVYPLSLHWTGDTSAQPFSRAATASTDGKVDLELSSGMGDGADLSRWNPEDLLGASLAQCHLLTFLALAAKTQLKVLAYDDAVSVELDTVEKVTSVTRIVLSPTITVAAGTDVEKVKVMFEKAHKYCFIGNSLKSEVVMNPTVVVA